MRIKYFRGVFMRNALPKKVKQKESGIVNLDDFINSGTHWVCYWKDGDKKYYFDSYGDLKPPREIVRYLGKNIIYNEAQVQKFNTTICGQLCLKVLSSLSEGNDFSKIINEFKP